MTSKKHAPRVPPTITYVINNETDEVVQGGGQVTQATSIRFAGNAMARDRLHMYNHGQRLGEFEIFVPDLGLWEFIPPRFGKGDYSITVKSVESGEMSALPWRFVVVRPHPHP